MKIAIILGRTALKNDPVFAEMHDTLSQKGFDLYFIESGSSLLPATDLVLSVGGDGTFLSAAAIAAPAGIPVLGVNMGRLGFLSENTCGAAVEALVKNKYTVEERIMLDSEVSGVKYTSLNEVCVHRSNSGMLGTKVIVDGRILPTYWADGLLISTPSGSTAYSLSAGGPIVLPTSDVLIITPIAPHNLNVRPLVVPASSDISLSFSCRFDQVRIATDNTSRSIPSSSVVSVRKAPFTLKKICLENTSFINALSEKLFWGQDKRSEK